MNTLLIPLGITGSQSLLHNRNTLGLAHPERWSYEDNAVSSDEQHGDVPLGRLKRQKNDGWKKIFFNVTKTDILLFSKELYPGQIASLSEDWHTKMYAYCYN